MMGQNNIAALILTRNRAMQLHGCIQSIKKNCPEIMDFCILEKTTNEHYQNQYQMVYNELLKDKRSDISLDTNFAYCFLKFLDRLSKKFQYLLCFTDDTFFYRPIELLTNTVNSYFDTFNETLLTIQLRLGKNTIYQDPNDLSKLMNVPNGSVWEWTKQPENKNPGYPISLDGNIYKTEDLLKLSESIEFNNLREWEGNLIGIVNQKDNYWAKEKSRMARLPDSYTVNSAFNFTQYPFLEKTGPFGISIIDLAQKFDKGERIDLDKTFENITVNGSHMNFPLVFRSIN